MAATANATIARPAESGSGLLTALLQTAINFLARAEDSRPAARTAATVDAPASNDVDLWKLYRMTVAKGSYSPKVREMLQRADDE